jgi:hypothetical protein
VTKQIQISTPRQKSNLGAISRVKWITSYYDLRETLCYGTELGYMGFWRQDPRGNFEEIFCERMGSGSGILSIALDEPSRDSVQLAIGTRGRVVQVWKYDCNGLLQNVFSVQLDKTVPITVAFVARDVRVFGSFDGSMCVHSHSRLLFLYCRLVSVTR